MSEVAARVPRAGVGAEVTAFATGLVVFAALAVLARVATAIGAQSLALVWPASGAAILWYLWCSHTSWRLASLGAGALVLALAMVATGSGWTLAWVVAVAGTAQAVVCVLLLRQWTPSLLGVRGSAGLHDLRHLLGFLSAVAVGTLVGAAVASLLVQLLVPSTPSGAGVLDWWGRHLTGAVIVGCVGHLVWEWWRDRDALPTARVGPDGYARWPESAALVLAAVAGYVFVFANADAQLAFVLVAVAVWAGARLPTLWAGLLSALCGTVACGLTLAGVGPFAGLATPQLNALVTQAFVLTITLLTLAIAVGRDERLALLGELAAANRDTGARAELLDAVTEAMAEGIAVIDAGGRVVRSNAAAREVLGGPDGESDGRVERVFRPDGRPVAEQDRASQRARRERRVVVEDVAVAGPDGSRRVLSLRAVPLTQGADDGVPQAALVVSRDVTEERVAQDRLSEFAEVAAHDLRTPLTATRGWVEQAADLAEDLPEGPLRAGLVHALQRAERTADRMADLIRDLLASAGKGTLEPEVVPLAGPAGLVVAVARELRCEKHVVVDPATPALYVDPDLCHQLLANLVSNAVKYVAPGVEPRVEISGERHGGRAVVRVSDNGIGVPEDERERVFDRLHRVPTSAGAYVGTGLGLAICRDVVDRHGGSIRCEAGPEGGTVFVMELAAG